MTKPVESLQRSLRRWRLAALAATLAAVALALMLVAERRSGRRIAGDEPAGETVERLLLRSETWDRLPGWRADDPTEALSALRRSCAVFERRPPTAALGAAGLGGRAGDWRPLCSRLAALGDPDGETLRAFLEREMRPWAMASAAGDPCLLTGYYEPTLRGSRERAPGYDHPVYRRPPELVEVDLGAFRSGLAGRRIAGVVEGGRLRPYAERAAIDAGALAGRGLELAWVDDPVDLFFLHVQGSGRIELADGGVMGVGFAGQNGHPYHAIGRALVARGALTRDEVSMQSIRGWLEANRAQAAAVMAENPSFVFFRPRAAGGPSGALGVELTPRRSAAVDRRFVPLGVPLWVDTTLPARPGADEEPWRRLVLAQDTGGAIRGPLRADLFWGAGEEAAEIAGRMRQEGRLWLLLPRSLEAATAAWIAAAE